MKKLVIIPAYNESASIKKTIEEIKEKAPDFDYVIINDCSTDNTKKICEENHYNVINLPINLGIGGAVQTGYKYGYNEGYDYAVQVDGDGQHNPDEIPKLIEPIINDEADFVNGSRYMNGPEENTPAYRRVGQQVLDKATNISAGCNVTDSQSGFRAFSSKCCDCFRFKDTGFGIESEMLVDAAENGFRIKEVPITVRYDVDGSTKNPVTHGVGVLLNICKDKIIRIFKRN